ncbi:MULTISPECIES: sigma-70 family RNA polymerase sigma factor [unclassified Burkholderia]|uniref:sigma-70 family RNA polymerase sigma factor n=1 Tax=unclassified Burkholderia TaxID=2613784 RepID=UPI00075A24E6|nr:MULTISPECIES: sigma-70 family RNA polymerase sigma factor [unclassified Burkholderia]KVN16619.1 RNA polymerase subunit sigma [Burkholderia sp. MSMB1552]KWZ51021.1 RNA polymerase subunit sigma [Burkholderia sp. MSMB1588]
MTDDIRHDGARLRTNEPDAAPSAPDDACARPAIRADGSPDWSTLMARAQAGDRDAYRRLLASVTPYLRRFAARHGVHADAVEDVVQDILITVHEVRRTYDPGRPFGPWLVAIAGRRVVDALRRSGRAAAREVPLDPEHETLPADGANLMEETADARTLRDMLGRLPAGQRDAIRLLKLEEMSLKEAALATGMTVVALKVAVHRGIATLRRLLQEREEERR